MIAQICGILLEKNVESVIVDACGIGYEIFVPANVLLDIGVTGEKVTLKTHLDVKEDSLLLYGFLAREQLEMFRLLTSVSKIGPKIGLNVLSVMDVDTIARSITEENVANFTAVSGIGNKTGKRIILELAEKVAKRFGAVGSSTSVASAKGTIAPVWNLARNALEAQGFSSGEVEKRIKWAKSKLGDEPTIQKLLSQALQYSGE